MKAGTSSLASYLSAHPDVFLCRPKEPDFFVAEANWSRGVGWYAQHFAAADRGAVVGEASTNYTKFPLFSGVAARMRATLPEARLLYLVRDPVERVVSHYRHRLLRGQEGRPLRVALQDGDSYLAPSRYGDQLERYLEHFERSQVLVLYSDDLRDRRLRTVRRAVAHIGADPGRTPPALDWVEHETAGRHGPSPLGQRLQRLPLYRMLSPLVPAAVKRCARRWTRRAILDLDPELWTLDGATVRALQREFRPQLGLVRALAGPTPWSWAEEGK